MLLSTETQQVQAYLQRAELIPASTAEWRNMRESFKDRQLLLALAQVRDHLATP
jgi:hypothetical protein